MATTREEFVYDDRGFGVEAFQEGDQWKGRFIVRECVDNFEQEHEFLIEGLFPTARDALDAAKRGAIHFAA